jgi:predicted nucleotidyltransferase
MSLIGDSLFTKTQQKVLALLYGNPQKSFYLKEILRKTGMGVATIKSELDSLLSSGILSMTKIGNQHHYQANTNCPIYSELVSIVKKTFGIADVIKNACAPIEKEIDLAFIYGSVAKGEETANSDIDLFVISNLALADLMKALTVVEKELGRKINPSIYTNKQVKSRIKQKNAFITRIMKQPKLWILGDENELKKLR